MRFAEEHKGLWRARVIVSPELRPHLPPPHTGRKRFLQSTGIPVKGGNANEAQRIIDRYVHDVAEPGIEHAKLARHGDGIVPVMRVEHPQHISLPLLVNSMFADRMIGARHLQIVSPPAPPENGPVEIETIIGLQAQGRRSRLPMTPARRLLHVARGSECASRGKRWRNGRARQGG
jgi:hypothetical protein